jgi:glycerophosphoryl diester phosphodiesterase
LGLLLIAIGGVVILITIVNLITSLLGSTTFAVLLIGLYRELGAAEQGERVRLEAPEKLLERKVFRISRRAILAGVVVSVILAAVVGGTLVLLVRTDDNIDIMAHRGASAAAPENTLAAVQRAIDDGAQWVEIDVQESRDGVVLVVHDSDLKRVGGSNLKIWEATAEELRRVDIGSWLDPQFHEQRVPTLAEVLERCKGTATNVNIELKYYGKNERLEQRVVEIVEARDMQDRIVVMSLDMKGVRRIKELRPDWQVGLLTAVVVGDLTELDVDFLAVNMGIATRSFIRAAHRSNKKVFVWTVNDAVSMSVMIGRGADALITDKPALARTVIAQRAKMSSVERLLIELAVYFGAVPESLRDLKQ